MSSWLLLMENPANGAIIIPILWPTDRGSVPLGPAIGESGSIGSLSLCEMFASSLWICSITKTAKDLLDHVDHVSRLTISRSFYWICFPSNRVLKSLYRLDVSTGLAANLLAPGIPPCKVIVVFVQTEPALKRYLN